MNEEKMHPLIAIVRYDRETEEIANTLRVLKKEIDELEAHESISNKNLATLGSIVASAQEAVTKSEHVARDYDARIVVAREHLDLAKNSQQYSTAKAALEKSLALQQRNEKTLIDAWSVLDSATKRYQTELLKSREHIASLGLAKSTKQKELSDLEAIMHTRIEERVALLHRLHQVVPIDIIDAYESMRTQVADPVAMPQQQSCSACFYPMTAQALQDLAHGRLLRCKGCYRILMSDTNNDINNEE